MSDIDDVGIRGNTGNNAFHHTYIAIALAKVSHQSDNGMMMGGNRLRHGLFVLPFFPGNFTLQNSKVLKAILWYICVLY